MDKISVIIPVYNREEKIKRCLESVLNQTYNNLEIIIVNDGSTDHTLEIVQSYMKEYPKKITLVNKMNEGVSAARNDGVKIATGKYLGFVDSDDYIDKYMYEKLYKKMIVKDYDLVGCNVSVLYPNKQVTVKSGLKNNQTNKNLLIDSYAVLWNKLYKSELVKKLSFKNDFWYEDVLFLYQLYPMINRFSEVDEILYFYIQNEDSITYSYNEKLYQLIENMDDIVTYYEKNNLLNSFYEEIEYSYVRYLFATFVKRLAKAKDKEKFNEGIKYVQKKVKEKFPKYRGNIYIKKMMGKSIYLRSFNTFIAQLIFYLEKDRMN